MSRCFCRLVSKTIVEPSSLAVTGPLPSKLSRGPIFGLAAPSSLNRPDSMLVSPADAATENVKAEHKTAIRVRRDDIRTLLLMLLAGLLARERDAVFDEGRALLIH